MRKNKKGFTLIELLAVIVVLAIIMVIATQQVTKTINTARVNAFNSSYKIIEKEIKNRIDMEKLGYTSQITCDDEDTDIDKRCSTIYEISAEDYKMKVTGDGTNGYALSFAANDNGKYASIDFIEEKEEPVDNESKYSSPDCPVEKACDANSVSVNINLNGDVQPKGPAVLAEEFNNIFEALVEKVSLNDDNKIDTDELSKIIDEIDYNDYIVYIDKSYPKDLYMYAKPGGKYEKVNLYFLEGKSKNFYYSNIVKGITTSFTINEGSNEVEYIFPSKKSNNYYLIYPVIDKVEFSYLPPEVSLCYMGQTQAYSTEYNESLRKCAVTKNKSTSGGKGLWFNDKDNKAIEGIYITYLNTGFYQEK